MRTARSALSGRRVDRLIIPRHRRTFSTASAETARKVLEARKRALVQPDGAPAFFKGGHSTCTFALPLGAPAALQEAVLDLSIKASLEARAVLNWWSERESSLQKLYPLETDADGNCLLHSLSLALAGVHDRDLTLRTALHSTLQSKHAGHVFRQRWHVVQDERNKKELEGFEGFVLDDEQWDREWQALVDRAGEAGRSLEDLHVLTLAHILKRPIIVYAPTILESIEGDAVAPVDFGGLYLPVLSEPSGCMRDPLVVAYFNGHFVPLLTTAFPCKGARRARSLLPIVSAGGARFDVRYHLEQLDGSAEECIRKYLDVTTVQLACGSPCLCVDRHGVNTDDEVQKLAMSLVAEFREGGVSASRSSSPVLSRSSGDLQTSHLAQQPVFNDERIPHLEIIRKNAVDDSAEGWERVPSGRRDLRKCGEKGTRKTIKSLSSGSGLSTKEEEGFLEALIGVITPEEDGKRSVAAINSLPEQELQEWARAERLSGARRRERRADDNRERVIEERGEKESEEARRKQEDAASLRLALQLDREEKDAVRWQRDQQDTQREGGQAGRKGWEHDVIAPGVAPPKVDTLVAGNLNGDFALHDVQRGVVSSGLKHDVHGYGQHFKHQFPQGQMSHQSMPQSSMYHPHQMQGILHSVQQNQYNVHQREGPRWQMQEAHDVEQVLRYHHDAKLFGHNQTDRHHHQPLSCQPHQFYASGSDLQTPHQVHQTHQHRDNVPFPPMRPWHVDGSRSPAQGMFPPAMSGLLLNDNNVPVPPKFPYLTWNPSPDGMPWNEMQKVQTLPNCSGPHASMKPPAQDQAAANGTDGLGPGGQERENPRGQNGRHFPDQSGQNVSEVGANPRGGHKERHNGRRRAGQRKMHSFEDGHEQLEQSKATDGASLLEVSYGDGDGGTTPLKMRHLDHLAEKTVESNISAGTTLNGGSPSVERVNVNRNRAEGKRSQMRFYRAPGTRARLPEAKEGQAREDRQRQPAVSRAQIRQKDLD